MLYHPWQGTAFSVCFLLQLRQMFLILRPQACNFIKKDTLAQVFSCEFCEIPKNTFFTEHLWTIASSAIHILISFWMTLVSIENQKFRIIITIRRNTRMLSKFLSSNINRIVCSLYRCILVLDIKLFDSIFRELPKLIWYFFIFGSWFMKRKRKSVYYFTTFNSFLSYYQKTCKLCFLNLFLSLIKGERK